MSTLFSAPRLLVDGRRRSAFGAFFGSKAATVTRFVNRYRSDLFVARKFDRLFQVFVIAETDDHAAGHTRIERQRSSQANAEEFRIGIDKLRNLRAGNNRGSVVLFQFLVQFLQ